MDERMAQYHVVLTAAPGDYGSGSGSDRRTVRVRQANDGHHAVEGGTRPSAGWGPPRPYHPPLSDHPLTTIPERSPCTEGDRWQGDSPPSRMANRENDESPQVSVGVA